MSALVEFLKFDNYVFDLKTISGERHAIISEFSLLWGSNLYLEAHMLWLLRLTAFFWTTESFHRPDSISASLFFTRDGGTGVRVLVQMPWGYENSCSNLSGRLFFLRWCFTLTASSYSALQDSSFSWMEMALSLISSTGTCPLTPFEQLFLVGSMSICRAGRKIRRRESELLGTAKGLGYYVEPKFHYTDTKENSSGQLDDSVCAFTKRNGNFCSSKIMLCTWESFCFTSSAFTLLFLFLFTERCRQGVLFVPYSVWWEWEFALGR